MDSRVDWDGGHRGRQAQASTEMIQLHGQMAQHPEGPHRQYEQLNFQW